MTGIWYVLAIFQGFIAIAQIATGVDASHVTTLCMLSLILAKLSERNNRK